jgi:hypothetical protein
MIRRITQKEIFEKNPFRYYLTVDLEDDYSTLGFNEHYQFDTPIKEAMNDFIACAKCEADREHRTILWDTLDIVISGRKSLLSEVIIG